MIYSIRVGTIKQIRKYEGLKMSKIIKGTGVRELSHIVELNNKYYFVDSNDTLDVGYETMVFSCDKNGDSIDWSGLYTERYNTEEEMRESHYKVCNELENYL